MKKRIVRRPLTPDQHLPTHLNPVLKRIYAARQLNSSRELEHSFHHLPVVSELKGLDQAVDLLQIALAEGRRILIVADFDADGATSCATAVRGLRLLGAADVCYVVPNRFKFGYGLTPEIVEVASRSDPWLLVTVDNGISSIEGVAAAKRAGIRVLVTDHHLPGAELPAADAIVNPNQPGDTFPSKNLAGVGVIFYVLLALRARLRETNWFATHSIAEPNLAQLLDLVALGTVADVVPLDHLNRILVSQGLARIRQGACCEGIKALLAIAGRQQQRLIANDLGYAVGPRLNAAGRLEDMSLGIECLLADDAAVAKTIAEKLDLLNRERREIENQMQEQAMATLATMKLEAITALPSGVCLFDETWHQGVIGILASRVKDKLHRPVIAFAAAGGDEIKGSARSIAGLHIRDALDAIATRHPGLLHKFGGHAMAAGLSLKRNNFNAFRAAFEEEVARQLNDELLESVVYTDGELRQEDLCVELAECLREAGPWGQAFPEPLFDGIFDVLERRLVAEKHLKLTLRHADGIKIVSAMAFNTQDDITFAQRQRVHVAYRLDVNDYRGERTPQLVVEYGEKIGA